jgi:putative nucleotidyltransferase with HDIG domain
MGLRHALDWSSVEEFLHRPLTLSLTARILGALLTGLALTVIAIGWRSELVIEGAMLDQAKRQALVFLQGIDREIGARGSPRDPVLVQSVLERAVVHEQGHDSPGFSILRIYAYDRDGNIYANVGEGGLGRRDMSGKYGAVVQHGRRYLGNETEQFREPLSGRMIPKADVIIPLRENGAIVAGLEVEINLDETAALIKHLDDTYEYEMFNLLVISAVIMLGFFWLIIHTWLIAPLRSIGALTHRIAEGDFSTRTALLPDDEIGRLGRSINSMAASLEALFDEQEKAYLQVMQSLAKALEVKDAYTARHSARVAKYSVMLGRRLGLSEDQLQLLRQGALMHDLGKIGIADAILNKPGLLDEAEYEVMRTHPVITAEIMRPLQRFKEFAEIAAWHHERWDGNGYPDGLKGEAIPLLARIVAIADAWDAMTGDRVYRAGMPAEKALSIMEAERDHGQWDPRLVDAFVELVRGEQAAREGVMRGVLDSDLEPPWAASQSLLALQRAVPSDSAARV